MFKSISTNTVFCFFSSWSLIKNEYFGHFLKFKRNGLKRKVVESKNSEHMQTQMGLLEKKILLTNSAVFVNKEI